MKKLKRTLALLALLGLAQTAQAAAVRVTFDRNIFEGSGYDVVQVTAPGATLGTTLVENTAAGRFKGTGDQLDDVNPSIFVDGLDNLFMYCYDVYESIHGGQIVEYTINFSGEKERTRDFLGAVNAVMNGSKQLGDIGYDKFAWLHPVSGAQGAAIQLGIWESRYETSTDWDLALGDFRAARVDSLTFTHWNAFRKAIDSSASVADEFVMVLEARGAQDMITADPPSQVPEPATVGLLAVAMAALGLARKRAKR
jgi:hypothetical protein